LPAAGGVQLPPDQRLDVERAGVLHPDLAAGGARVVQNPVPVGRAAGNLQ